MEPLKHAGDSNPRPEKVSMLTLDKAIEILSNPAYDRYKTVNPDFPDAIKLLIEAAKRFKALREVIRVPYTDPLPGEDPE